MNRESLSHAGVRRALQSLLLHELARLRQQSALTLTSQFEHPDLYIGPATSAGLASLEADSFELIALATRVTSFFQLHRSGIEDYLLRDTRLEAWVELVLTSRQRGHRDMTFYTSGTTGEPKACPHNWSSLCWEARFFHNEFCRLMQTGGPKRVIVLVPCHHLYGFLFGVLMPAMLDLDVFVGPRALGMAQSRQLQAGDLIVGFPFVWQQLSSQGAAFPADIMGLCSTAPAPTGLGESLKQLGLDVWGEIYGSSETGGIGFRTESNAPFELLPRWCAEGSGLFDLHQQQKVTPGDYLHWQSDRALLPNGRRDGALQVGGINIYPDAIARQLAALPGVAAARIEPLPDSERLQAHVYPSGDNTDPAALRAQLLQWCSRHLTAAERPVVITLATESGDTIYQHQHRAAGG